MKQTLANMLILLAAMLAVSTTAVADNVKAFPGASGWAENVTGGRGGKVYYVTSLKDCSDDELVAGTLRWALNSGDNSPRTILFAVNGTIYLESKLKTKHPNVSILGQSAPGGGICITGYPVVINSHNFIVRYIRFRAGEVPALESGGNESFSGLDIENAYDVIVDHCSVTWSMEECLTMFDNDTTTVQNCIIGEGLYHSYNVKTTGDDSGRAFAMQWGGDHSNMHHTLITNCNGRAPRFNGVREANAWLAGKDGKQYAHDVHIDGDFVNNVFYNWGGGHLSYYGGEFYADNFADAPADLNAYNRIFMRNNYFRPGPSTQKNGANYRHFFHPSGDTDRQIGQWYLSGNKFELSSYWAPTGQYWTDASLKTVNDDNLAGYGTNTTALDLQKAYQSHVLTAIPDGALAAGYSLETADDAYAKVVDSSRGAGANLPRYDEEDQRLIDEAAGRRDAATPFVGSRSTSAANRPGIIDCPDDVKFSNGYDTFTTAAGNTYAYCPSLAMKDGEKYAIDSDADGMPDAYEDLNGFNKLDPADGAATAANGYTNLENYLNAIADFSISNATFQTSDTFVEPGEALRPDNVTITFNVGSSYEGTAPEPVTLPYGGTFTVPANNNIYREGYTVTGWGDGSSNYYIGKTYTITQDITLSPASSKNLTNLSDRKEGVSLKWSFKQGSNAPQIGEGRQGAYVIQKEVEGNTIDVRMKYNGSVISVPSCLGSTATVWYTDNTSQTATGTQDGLLDITLSNPQAIYRVDVSLPYVLQVPDGQQFHAPQCATGKDYELVYTSDSLTVANLGDWIIHTYDATSSTCNYTTRNALQPTIEEDNYLNTTVQPGVYVAGTSKTLYMYITGVGRVKAYVSGSNSTGDYIQMVAMPTDGTENQTAVSPRKYAKSGSGMEDLCGSVELTLDPAKSYRVDINSVSALDMIVTALKLYTTGGQAAPARYAITANANPIIGGEATVVPTLNSYPVDSEVTLTATAEDGYFLDYWADASGNKVSIDEQYTVTVSGDASYTAYFRAIADREQKIYDREVSTVDELLDALHYGRYQGTADRPYRIFLHNGTYDLGTRVLTELGSYESLIGESQDGVVIVNYPAPDNTTSRELKTPTLFIDQDKTDVYLQDLTIRQGIDWATKQSSGQAMAMRQRGKQVVYKNVTMQGIQDTYYLNKSTATAYLENCTVAGQTDYVYGDGTAWLEGCTLYNTGTNAGYITAPNTQPGDSNWGLVFNNCTIDGTCQSGSFYLGRPWGDSPHATYLNTTMLQTPHQYGWGPMTSSLVLRFHEYNSLDANGNAIDLSTRSVTQRRGAFGLSTSDNPVLTAEQAAKYTLANVFPAWDAKAIAQQLAATQPIIDQQSTILGWDEVPGAYAYAIVKNGDIVAFTQDNRYLTNDASATYTIRVANQRGGLGAPSAAATPGTVGIRNINADDAASATTSAAAPAYNTLGQRVDAAHRGIIIQRGAKRINR